MLEIDSSALLAAATDLARVHQIFSGIGEARDQTLIPSSVEMMLPPLESFEEQAKILGASLAVIASQRLRVALSEEPCRLTVGVSTQRLHEVESRFADHLIEIKMLALTSQDAVLLQSADELIEIEGFSVAFPSAAFEVEEDRKSTRLNSSH